MTELADNLRFLRALIARPKSIGAIFPSSPALAEAIARQIDPAAGPVLELGPGTGVVTAILARGIAPERLTLVEYDEEFARHLAARFAGVHVVQGDAFDLDRTLARQPFGAIVSCLPLLNFPMAQRLAFMDGVGSPASARRALDPVFLWPACPGGAARRLCRHLHRLGDGQPAPRQGLGLPPGLTTLFLSLRLPPTLHTAPYAAAICD